MNAKAYFLRLDIFRTISRVLLVVFILLAYGMRSVSPGVAGIVTVVVGLIVFGIGSVLRVPQAGEITDLISKERCILETEILKENKNFRDGSPVCIHAYGNAHQRFARTAHGRLIYPTCLNMMFLKHGHGGILMTGELSLWKKSPTEKKQYHFSELSVRVLRLEGDAEILWVTFLDEGAEKLSFFVRDDHYWKSFVSDVADVVSVTESNVS